MLNKKLKTKKEEDYDDDNCEVCKLMRLRGGDVTSEELEKAMSLQNFLNNLPNPNKDNKK